MNESLFNHLIQLVAKTNEFEDIPVAAIIVDENNLIISQGWNTRNKTKNIACHAEINAINEAIERNLNLNLSGYKIMSTLEPCEMCYGAIKQARIKHVEYITDNSKFGINSIYSLNDIDLSLVKNSNNKQEAEYKKILENFFKKLR